MIVNVIITIDSYVLIDWMVSLFLNFLKWSVYANVFTKTSDNSCSSSAFSFCDFRWASNICTSDIRSVSAFANSVTNKFHSVLERPLMKIHPMIEDLLTFGKLQIGGVFFDYGLRIEICHLKGLSSFVIATVNCQNKITWIRCNNKLITEWNYF